MVKFKGLDVNEFAHPDGAISDDLTNSKILEFLATSPTQIAMATQLLRSYIHVSEKDLPRVYNLLKEVCETLDYPKMPEIYMNRSEEFDWKIYLDDTPIIVLTDFAINNFDDEMLKFHLGCAVTSLKANSRQLRI